MADYVPPTSPFVNFVFGELHNPYTPPVSPFVPVVFGEVAGNPYAGTYDQANFMLILTQ